MVSTHCRG